MRLGHESSVSSTFSSVPGTFSCAAGTTRAFLAGSSAFFARDSAFFARFLRFSHVVVRFSHKLCVFRMELCVSGTITFLFHWFGRGGASTGWRGCGERGSSSAAPPARVPRLTLGMIGRKRRLAAALQISSAGGARCRARRDLPAHERLVRRTRSRPRRRALTRRGTGSSQRQRGPESPDRSPRDLPCGRSK